MIFSKLSILTAAHLRWSLNSSFYFIPTLDRPYWVNEKRPFWEHSLSLFLYNMNIILASFWKEGGVLAYIHWLGYSLW